MKSTVEWMVTPVAHQRETRPCTRPGARGGENECYVCIPGGGPGGLSLTAGTSQAPQLVAPEANIRRDDHRGLHDARRRFNLAKSHGAS